MKPRWGTRLITFKGQTKTVREWAEHLGMSVNSMRRRLKMWSIDRAMTATKTKWGGPKKPEREGLGT